MGQNAGESTRQLAFEFAGNASDGPSIWREQQQTAFRCLGAELGLPLGAQCEVFLESGLILRGRLLFNEDDFFPSARRDSAVLRIGDVNFSIGEIASCVRID
jgi:hypothetical protein